MSAFMSKTSTESRRGRPKAQAKPCEDALLAAWEKTRAEEPRRPAIFDPAGTVVRTFSAIERRSRFYAQKLGDLAPGDILAIQIGNHADWPPLLLACLRRR